MVALCDYSQPITSHCRLRGLHEKLLSTLPVPGTAGFPVLRDGLTEYGLKASQMRLDNALILSAAVLHIDLLDGRLSVAISYTDFQMKASRLYYDDIPKFKEIAAVLFKVVNALDPGFTKGKAGVKYSAHFVLEDNDSAGFLKEHLGNSKLPGDWLPHAFVYGLDSLYAGDTVGIVVTKSLVFPGGLYMDISSDRA